MARSYVARLAQFALVLSILSFVSVAYAIPRRRPSVPEITPSTVASAMAVLGSSGLILAERMRRRRATN